jgi:hypothetical protein
MADTTSSRPKNSFTYPYRRTSRRRVNVLLFLTEKIGTEVLPQLIPDPDLNIRVVSENPKSDFLDVMEDGIDMSSVQWIENEPQDPYRNHTKMQGHLLAKWADLLFVVGDAEMVSLMLVGITNSIILHVLRCWDTSKRIFMLPEMSMDQHKHPIWRKQLSKIQRRWDWIHVLPPALWRYDFSSLQCQNTGDEDTEMLWDWDGPVEVVEAIRSEGQSVLRSSQPRTSISYPKSVVSRSPSSKPQLPPEIWTIILDYNGDWELAQALGVFTHLPTPYEWTTLVPKINTTTGRMSRSLEWLILTQPTARIEEHFASNPPSRSAPLSPLSPLATKLIFKNSLTSLLTYLALHQKDLFYPSFGLALLPHKASLIYNSPPILSWWRSCPAVLTKEYGPEALDGASRANFVDVLDWWLHSGLRLQYTEKALESASAKGHVQVLDWWKRASDSRSQGPEAEQLPLKVGKSILLAAQSGRTESISWFHHSNLPYSHSESVARLASTHGHVSVLELWRQLKGSKMIFDNQVLVGATKNGHAEVLEWWKNASREFGFVVEYKTCDIEEAMEDAVGGGGEGEVREWWGRNGLNLGVGTGEWMRVKTL